MEIVSKLTDALLMFWQSLDERERRYLIYLALYVAATVALSMQHASRERLKRELRDELHSGS